jgi:hypothetical protein
VRAAKPLTKRFRVCRAIGGTSFCFQRLILCGQLSPPWKRRPSHTARNCAVHDRMANRHPWFNGPDPSIVIISGLLNRSLWISQTRERTYRLPFQWLPVRYSGSLRCYSRTSPLGFGAFSGSLCSSCSCNNGALRRLLVGLTCPSWQVRQAAYDASS